MTDELIASPEPQPEPEAVPVDAPVAQPEPGVAGAVSEPAASAAPPNVLPTMEAPGRYTVRFAFVYTGLGIILAAALTGLIVLVIRPGYHPGPQWSTWKPAGGSTSTLTSQIADHVGHDYRLGPKGGQLVAVVASPAVVTSGTTNVSIKYVAVRKAPQSNTGIAIYPAGKTEEFTLCGLGSHCSIASGKPSTTRGQLVRREVLELALYTFKFSPSVDAIAAFMPPPPGQTTTPLVYLRKDDLKQELRQPLSKTLPVAPTPLPTNPDLTEKKTIDALTLPHMYTYGLEALQSGGALLILDPAS